MQLSRWNPTRCFSVLASLVTVSGVGCADDPDVSTDSETMESTGDDAPDDTAAEPADDTSDTGVDTSGDATGGELGPTAQVRIVNLVPGVTFAAWGADTNFDPVLVAEDIAFESVTDYFGAPLNEFTMHPELVLLPMGQTPDDVATWQVDNGVGGDRGFVIFTELDAPDEQATIVLTLDRFTGNVQWEQLDETQLMLGDATMANLHISWALELEPPIVAAFAIAGDPCLFDGSTGVAPAWPVMPGTFDVAIYDRQTVNECTEQLGSASITAAAGEQVLVAIYDVDEQVRFLTAPIPQ